MASLGSDPAAATARTPILHANAPATWFRVVMWIGIAANILLALVSIAWSASVLSRVGLEPAHPLVWPRFAAFLLILLSVFYVPSAFDPLRNRYSAIVSVLCRFGGAAFFAIAGGRYIVFGLFDLVFGLPQAILLHLAWRRARST